MHKNLLKMSIQDYRGLNFGLSLPLFSYFVYARKKGSGKTVVCTGSFEPSLLADAISTKISCADPYALRPNKKTRGPEGPEALT